MSNESLHVGLAIAVCVAGFVTVAGVAWAVTCVLFDKAGHLRRRKEAALDAVAVSRRREPWGDR